MKFLVDAQLPRALATAILQAGHSAIHTLDLPDGNRTNDRAVAEVADQEDRWVITKDSDFVATHLLQARPQRLLLISTGNGTNRDLISLVLMAIRSLDTEGKNLTFVEVTLAGTIIHS
jgi:predicted nuclease of predicted toxin-antitoxin system